MLMLALVVSGKPKAGFHLQLQLSPNLRESLSSHFIILVTSSPFRLDIPLTLQLHHLDSKLLRESFRQVVICHEISYGLKV